MRRFILISLVFISIQLSAQNTDHFTWLTGTWIGPGFDGTFEEIWSEPDANGDLIGMFRYTNKEGKLVFYEFWVLSKTGMKLRHFNPDFTAWESKEDFIDFTMVETTPDKITLKGLSYERMSNNEMKIVLRLKQDGEAKDHVFNLKREER